MKIMHSNTLNFRDVEKGEIIIPVYVDYGAELWLWYFPSNEKNDVLEWWKNQSEIDIYKRKISSLLCGEVVEAISKEDKFYVDHFYSVSDIRAMLDSGSVSYLIFQGIKYSSI